jgi:hypothetical protein
MGLALLGCVWSPGGVNWAACEATFGLDLLLLDVDATANVGVFFELNEGNVCSFFFSVVDMGVDVYVYVYVCVYVYVYVCVGVGVDVDVCTCGWVCGYGYGATAWTAWAGRVPCTHCLRRFHGWCVADPACTCGVH